MFAIRVDGDCHPTHQVGLRMRILPSQDGVHLDHFPLPVQRLEIVSDSQQIAFRRQFVGRMAPVCVGKKTQLTTVYKGLQPVAYALKVLGTGVGPIRDGTG